MQMLRLLAIAAGAVLLSAPAVAQDAMEILKKVGDTYRNLSTFDMEHVTRDHHQSTGSNIEHERPERDFAALGKKYRQELPSIGLLTVCDGQFAWTYSADRNEYTKRRSNCAGGSALTSEFANITFRVKSARVLREEEVSLESGPVPCWVIEVQRDGQPPQTGETEVTHLPDTYWVDKVRLLVLKRTEGQTFKRSGTSPGEFVRTTLVTKLSLGQALPDTLFQFTPPEGAVEVEEFSSLPKSPLAGKELPAVELKDADGNAFSPALLRGNVAILYFQSSSLSDFDEERFLIEFIHRAYKGQGVVAYAVMPKRTQGAGQAPAIRHTFPTLVDTDGAFAKAMGISYNGIVVCGRDGKIAFVMPNISSTRGLREIVKILQKNGLW